MSDGRRTAKGSISVSVILGTLLVPLSGVAALMLTDTAESSNDAGAQTTTSTTVTATLAPSPTGTPSLEHDLVEACGSAGMQLVDLENDGSLTEIQQAALDALREVCDQEAMPLPPKALPEPTERTVFVLDTSDASASGHAADREDYDEDEYEYEDEYEGEDHEDGEHEDEYEDHEDDEDEDDDR